jgi:prevent-host-death family protein
MAHATIGIKELKDHLSATLDLVKAGSSVTVTERGRPIGRIVPLREPDLREKLLALSRTGYCTWSGDPFELPPIGAALTGSGLADAVNDDRDEREQSL